MLSEGLIVSLSLHDASQATRLESVRLGRTFHRLVNVSLTGQRLSPIARDREPPTRRLGPCRDRGWWLPDDRSARSPQFPQGGNRSPAARSVGFMPPVPLRRIDVAQIGAIGQEFFAGHAHILFHPPEQVRACSSRQVAIVREPKKFRSARQSMPFPRRGKHRFGQGDLARPVTVHLAAKQHVGAVLHQGYETNLRICACATAGPGREKASSLAFSSATSKVLPSRLTSRQVRYQAPRVTRTAMGLTNSSCNCCRGSQPSRVRAERCPTCLPHAPGRGVAKPTALLPTDIAIPRDRAIACKAPKAMTYVDNYLGGKGRVDECCLPVRTSTHDARIGKRLGDHAKTDVVRDRAPEEVRNVRANCGLLSCLIQNATLFIK